jgi:putative glutamine amidotransferase
MMMALAACGKPAESPRGTRNAVDLRFFATAPRDSDDIRLTILYPSTDSLDILRTLRDKRLLKLHNLTVIGVFHASEETDYHGAVKMVQDHGLDWIKFHRLEGELSQDSLFIENALSADFETIFDKSDGLLLFGGNDIPPYLYGEKTSLLTDIRSPYRHFLELSLVFHLLGGFQDQGFIPLLSSAPGFPILGICLGAQTLNVGTGGTLVQDLWSELYGADTVEDVIALDTENWHQNPHARLYPQADLTGVYLHPVKLLAKGAFVRKWGFSELDTPMILSSHHQAAEKLGCGLQVSATSLDGRVVEAFDHVRFPHVLGVQFHPESRRLYDPEFLIRLTPADTSGKSAYALLQDHPPSMEFHEQLWTWFEDCLEAHHKAKR